MKRFAGVALLLLAACNRGAAPAPIGKPNVLLITIDTLRADRVGRGLTPAIDGLAARGTRFSHARSTVPLTLPSHVSIMTGTLPAENGVRLNGVTLAGRPTLARAFHDAGYRTGAFVGAYVLDRRFGLSIGFDTYDDRVQRDPSGAARLEAERRGDVVVRRRAPVARRRQRQAVLRLDSSLRSACALRSAAGVPGKGRRRRLRRRGRVRRRAGCARCSTGCATSGQAERTVVAVTGDHGEGLGDHGELTHGMLAYDSTLRVPLVVAAARVKPGAERGCAACRSPISRGRCCTPRDSRSRPGCARARWAAAGRRMPKPSIREPPAGTTSPRSPSINGSWCCRRRPSCTT